MTDVKWKIEKDLCRCCHSEGSFRNLDAPFANDFGEEEIYGKMLREQLGIALFKIEGIMSEVTYTICEGCIFRLREATDFKRQVLSCEEKFHDMFNRNMFTVSDPTLTTVKKEVHDEIDINYVPADDDGDMGADDDDNYSLEDLKFSEDDDKPLGLSSIKKETPQKKRKTTVKSANKVTKKTNTKKAAKSKTKAETDMTESIPATSAEKKQGTSDHNLPPNPKDYTVLDKPGPAMCKCNRCHQHLHLSNFASHFARIHQCNVCPLTFDSGPLKADHIKKSHVDSINKTNAALFNCNTCDKQFLSSINLYNHFRKIHKEDSKICKVCGEKFSRRADMENHRFDVHSKKPMIQCTSCDYNTRRRAVMAAHVKRVHLKEKNYSCETCGRLYYDIGSLNEHMLRHRVVKEYVCDVCGKSFPRRGTIVSHLRSHFGVKTRVCKVCGQAFVQSGSLIYHMKKHHPGS